MNEHSIFGNEVANEDALLLDCKINNHLLEELPLRIMVGKWGAGKSATLILKAQKIAQELAKINPSIEDIWYITENQLDFPVLIKEFESSVDQLLFRKYLEKIWLAEILRRTVMLLGYLNDYYDNKVGYHWDFIRKNYKESKFAVTLWKQLPNVFKILRKSDSNQISAITDFTDSLSNLFKQEAFDHIKHCIRDIAQYPIQPFVAIEPLEQPDSDLDKQINLAQEVVNSLLNVFQEHFHPSESKPRIQVFMAIPWHRYENHDANLIHHLRQYTHTITWGKIELKKIINQRILWEFNRVSRRIFDKENPWISLFEETVVRTNFTPNIIEDSFSYLIRHTHYHPRDIIRVTRLSVINAAEDMNCSVEEILNKHKISLSSMRKAIHEFRRTSFEDLKIEMKRKYHSDFDDILELVLGLPQKFDTERLSKKLKSNEKYSFETVFLTLWHAGIIGLEAVCNDKEKENSDLEALLPKNNKKIDKNIRHESIIRWYFFEYNFKDNPIGLLHKFENSDFVSVKIIFHPKTFNSIPGTTTDNWPIGI